MKFIDKIIGDILCRLLSNVKKPSPKIAKDSVKKILVIKFIAMGDMLVISPLVNSLKSHYPEAQVDILAASKMKSVVDVMDLYDHRLYLSFSLSFLASIWSTVRRIRKERYDIILDLEFYYRLPTIMAVLAKPRYLIGFDLQSTRSKLMDRKINYDKDLHVCDAFLEIGYALGVEKSNYPLTPFSFSKEDANFVNAFIRDNHPLIVHVGASGRALSRRWPSEYWSKLLASLDKRNEIIVLVGAEEEAAILKTVEVPDSIVNLIGKLSLTQLAALMMKGSLYVGLDTGPTHLAAAMGTPLVALYGPNTPARWGPYTDRKRILYQNIECSPCTRQFEGIVSTCQDNICMKQLKPSTVLDAIESILG
jgi:heptosyltransferase I